MNRKKLNQIIATTIFSMVVAFSIPVDALASTAVVEKVSTNFENGIPVSKTVTSELQVYYGTIINVANINELRTEIEKCLISKNTSISLKYTGEDITNWNDAIYGSLTYVLDNPANDYAKYTMKSYNYSYNTIGDMTINFTYIETVEQSDFVATKVKEIIQTIITPEMSDDQKEKAVNDYMVSHIAYDTTLVQRSAYAALVEPYKTASQGYALLAYKMLTEAGLEARIITGNANGGPHAWNLVKINGNWYHLDTTGNDPVPDVEGRIRYDYFNLQDSQIGDSARKHTWDKSKYVGYECVTPYIPTDSDILNSERMNESKAPDVNNITIINNAVVPDTIKVTGLKAGDILKVFSDASTSAKVLATAKVTTDATEVNVNVPQLGAMAGKVYFSVLTQGSVESARIGKDFDGEPITTAISPESITVANTILGDKVTVSGLIEKDVVKIYDRADAKAKLLGTATVAVGKTEVTINIAQLGKLSGNVYVTVTSSSKRESEKVEKGFEGEPISNKPEVENIITTNNVGVSDTVKITGLSEKDMVKVYDKSDLTKKVIGKTTVALGKTEATISIPKFPAESGNIYVSVTSPSKLESELVEKSYEAELVTEAVAPEKITVTNTVIGDKVTVSDLLEKDVVKVYDKADSTAKLLGKATVAAGKTEATVNVAQLGRLEGSIYVTVTSSSKRESEKVEKSFEAEPISNMPEVENIVTTNNFGVPDTVKVTGLSEKDVVKVYDKSDLTRKVIGKATVAVGKTETIVSIPKFPAALGSVYISVTSPMKAESDLVEKAYIAEQVTEAFSPENITVRNTIIGDKVIVSGLLEKDEVKVYDKADSTAKIIGRATVVAGKTDATVNIAQLGRVSGSVYVTVTSYGKKESIKVEKGFDGELISEKPDVANIIATNNFVIADTVIVTGLSEKDIVKIYDKSDETKKIIGTATVAKGKTEAIVSMPKFPAGSGKIYVAITSPLKLESELVEKEYGEEQLTEEIAPEKINILNTISGDKVIISGLLEKDTVKIFDKNDGTEKVIGKGTVAIGKTETTINIAQLGKLSGIIYVTVTSLGKKESSKVEKIFDGEPVSEKPDVSNIVTTNNYIIADTVKVTGLSEKDIVKVYDKLDETKKIIGTLTVAKGKNEAIVSIPKFPDDSGNVYVSVTSPMKLESELVEKDYGEEQFTDAILSEKIVVTNTIVGDKITVVGLTEKDIVKVYDKEDNTAKIIGKATVAAGKTEATINVAQLGKESGTIYVSLTSYGKMEGPKVEKVFDGEPVTKKPDVMDIMTQNNAGLSDTIKVSGLSQKDVVKIYDKSDETKKVIGTATVEPGKTEAIITIPSFSDYYGYIYVSVTSPMKLESGLVQRAYGPEITTSAVSPSDITIVNALLGDKIIVSNLMEKDLVKVYGKADGIPNLIGTAVVAAGKTDAIINVPQLGKDGGVIFVTVTSYAKRESGMIGKKFDGEIVSVKPDIANITVTNNSIGVDSVKVTGLSEKDIVKVYDKAGSAKKLLGTSTVSIGKTEVIVTIPQLPQPSGSVYVSITSVMQLESELVEKSYTLQ